MRLYILDASARLQMFLHDGPMPVGLESATAEVDAGNASFVAPGLILVDGAPLFTADDARARAATAMNLAKT